MPVVLVVPDVPVVQDVSIYPIALINQNTPIESRIAIRIAMLEECEKSDQWSNKWTYIWEYANERQVRDFYMYAMHDICQSKLLHLFSTNDVLNGSIYDLLNCFKKIKSMDNLKLDEEIMSTIRETLIIKKMF